MKKTTRFGLFPVCFVALSALCPAAGCGQVILPVGGSLPSPVGFTFAGHWACQDGPHVAHINVVARPHGQIKASWTTIHESEEGFIGTFRVGFDHDKSRFLLLDENDPAALEYHTDGWKGRSLVLESRYTSDDLFAQARILYEVVGPRVFKVTWETLDVGGWQSEPAVTCRRVASQEKTMPHPVQDR